MSSSAPDPKPKPRILVVEDEESLREVTLEVLDRAGYETVPAEHGAEAVELFSRAPHSFALVVLDLSMPVMDGRECFARLLAIHPEVKVLLTTGYGALEGGNGLDPALLAGCLQKPYRIHELLKIVGDILAAGA
jgi:two-component system, cell cycle sensor histidine kinase and response regulator CckA